jgi:outer membrane protein assembly factor BamD
MPTPRFVLLVLALSTLSACGGSAASSLNYGDNARKAYADALEDFYDDDCIEAAPALSNVRREYPYTRFAALAELRMADCMFNDGKYSEAIQAYETFVRYRPSHVEVSYARFMVARSNYEQIPSEWLLSPPTYEREQRFTQDTLRLLRRFLLDFPDDPLVPKARRMADRAVKLLAAHELYVAGFYLDRDRPHAAIGRLRTLLNTYPGSGYEPRAMLLLGETFLEMQDRAEARKSFESLAKQFPKSEEAASARDHLQGLGS